MSTSAAALPPQEPKKARDRQKSVVDPVLVGDVDAAIAAVRRTRKYGPGLLGGAFSSLLAALLVQSFPDVFPEGVTGQNLARALIVSVGLLGSLITAHVATRSSSPSPTAESVTPSSDPDNYWLLVLQAKLYVLLGRWSQEKYKRICAALDDEHFLHHLPERSRSLAYENPKPKKARRAKSVRSLTNPIVAAPIGQTTAIPPPAEQVAAPPNGQAINLMPSPEAPVPIDPGAAGGHIASTARERRPVRRP
ncbi:hypothetical protein ATI61_103579 [Archangium gephyra]|uniref:DUF4231 domain-containing protein n=1 Tax=Archangium gephyra TaxID=48 RepID=A0ABX9K7E2_9BACT|nr:hypothetical protein ATI61_103579 [Archangium gephyra]